jgi:excinuclease ABC subunit C
MKIEDFKKLNLPDTPGVYFFKSGGKILYIGKATSLNDRVKSYFSRDLVLTRGGRIVRMIENSDTVTYKTTSSVLEALILEAFNIKKYKPDANILSKDDKSFNYVVITNERWPRVLTVRGRNLLYEAEGKQFKAAFGPFPHGGQLREALKIIRRIFPFRDKCIPYETQKEKFDNRKSTSRVPRDFVPITCFNSQIGLCPGVCAGKITYKEYGKNIKNLILFFEGRKDRIAKNLEREMKAYAKIKEFEKADVTKRQLFALNHIHDVSLLKREVFREADTAENFLAEANEAINRKEFRIEAYDIAHIAGSATVGVMVAVINGEAKKEEYRKFRIRGRNGVVGIDDTGNLKEVLVRRLGHSEWPLPNLVVIDGGQAQWNTAKEVLTERGNNIEIVAVTKDDKHKAREIIGSKGTVSLHNKEILLANSEAHRFAIAYHRNLLRKPFRVAKRYPQRGNSFRIDDRRGEE